MKIVAQCPQSLHKLIFPAFFRSKDGITTILVSKIMDSERFCITELPNGKSSVGHSLVYISAMYDLLGGQITLTNSWENEK